MAANSHSKYTVFTIKSKAKTDPQVKSLHITTVLFALFSDAFFFAA